MFREYMHRIYQALIRGKRRASRSGHRGRPSGRPAPRFRPRLEGLEDRTVPSAVNWIGGSGAWNDASHWDTGQVPTATDDAVISVASVTVTHSSGADAVNSLSASGGTFTLSGGTLTVTTTVSGDDAFMLSAGILANATVASGTTITGTSSGGMLSGVTFNGNLDLTNNASATVTGGLTLNGSTINLGDAAGSTFGELFFQGTQTLAGTGTVLLGGSFTNGLLSSGVANFTIGADILVHGQNGQINFGTQGFANQGTISADTAGGTISLGAFSNSGTIQSSSGSTLILQGTCSNSGTLSIGNSSTVTITGSLTQTAGTLTLASGSGLTTTTAITLQGGTLSGLGTITGDVLNTGSNVIVGDSGATVGILTITGNYTQVPGGTLSVKIGGATAGTQYDQLAVGGTATLDGTLNVTLIDGFTPNSGDTFQPLTSTAESGAFASLTGDGTMFTDSYAAGGVTLTEN